MGHEATIHESYILWSNWTVAHYSLRFYFSIQVSLSHNFRALKQNSSLYQLKPAISFLLKSFKSEKLTLENGQMPVIYVHLEPSCVAWKCPIKKYIYSYLMYQTYSYILIHGEEVFSLNLMVLVYSWITFNRGFPGKYLWGIKFVTLLSDTELELLT